MLYLQSKLNKNLSIFSQFSLYSTFDSFDKFDKRNLEKPRILDLDPLHCTTRRHYWYRLHTSSVIVADVTVGRGGEGKGVEGKGRGGEGGVYLTSTSAHGREG